KGKKKEFKTAAEIVRYLMDLHGVSQGKLRDTLKTTEDIQRIRNAFITLFKASSLYEDDQVAKVMADATEQELKPESKYVVFIRNAQSKDVSVCALDYLATTGSRKTFLREHYPQLSAKGSTGQSIANIIEHRRGELQKQGRRFISRAEFVHVKES